MKVLAALSGGVDSAVAAARAVEAGHEVTAVHMALSADSAQSRCGSRGCCTIEDADDARRAAAKIGIPFYVWDMAADFEETVIADFVRQYQAGLTPNPCVRCNEFVKFRELLRRGMALGFDAVCTGHYAQVRAGTTGPELHRAQCLEKDQSYVLAVMGRQALEHVLFPLGDVPDKASVRQEADARGLVMANKPDSYDICFIPDGNTRGFLQGRIGKQTGEIVDSDGNLLGYHEGYFGYTVGQRKGLNLGRPAPDGRPRYVLETRPRTNQVVVGPSELLSVCRIDAVDVIELAEDIRGQAHVQFRAHGRPVGAQVVLSEGGLSALLDAPVRAVAPGQSLVVYKGTRVVAEATITRAYR
ncbi:MAG: tRNA 2-thiouridine(34) synthase MnmA [Actinomycetaceae bacterium]|nr:tRNA 2-thiouridine(34) synthase MnmA [Actinomycetaceae bacterium]